MTDKIKITGQVLASGESPITGRIYLEEDLKRMVEEFNASKYPHFGEVMPTEGYTADYATVNMDKVSHTVDRLWFEDGAIMAEMSVLGTPQGDILREALDSESIFGEFKPSPIMTGTVEDGVVVDPILNRVDATFIPEED